MLFDLSSVVTSRWLLPLARRVTWNTYAANFC